LRIVCLTSKKRSREQD